MFWSFWSFWLFWSFWSFWSSFWYDIILVQEALDESQRPDGEARTLKTRFQRRSNALATGDTGDNAPLPRQVSDAQLEQIQQRGEIPKDMRCGSEVIPLETVLTSSVCFFVTFDFSG